MYIILGILSGALLVFVTCTIASIVTIYKERKQKDDEWKKLHECIKILEQENDDLQESLDIAKAQLHKEDISEDRDVLNAQKNQIIEDINKNRSELDKVNDQLKSLQDQLASSNSALASSQELRLQTESIVRDLQEQIAVLKPQRIELEGKINLLETQLKRLSS